MSECLVCSDTNAQHHYGTICCPSCKGFFRRVYLSAKNLECYRGNCCQITKATRNACRACRYKKCVQVGMNPNEIRGRADTSSPVTLPEMGDDIGPSTSSASAQQHCMEVDKVRLPSDCLMIENAEQLINLYLNLNRFCESTSVNSSDISRADEDVLIHRMLDATVLQLIDRTCPQCPRFTRNWKPTEFLDLYNFRRSWARDVVHLLDWANHFPIFKKLCSEDKVKVFIGRFTQFSLFTKCYRTYRESCSGLLLGCGNVFPFERNSRGNVENEYLRKLFSRLCDGLFNEVIFPMAHLSLNDATYVLIKACIFLFEGFAFTDLSPEGRAMISREKARHRSALLAHLNGKSDLIDEKLNHIIQIEHMMTSIEALSNFMDKEVQFLSVFGLLDMNRTLITECHLNKYKFSFQT